MTLNFVQMNAVVAVFNAGQRRMIASHGAKAVKLPLENDTQRRNSANKNGPERICLR